MNEQAPCACGLFIHPAVIHNVPGLPAVEYRVGDFASFRRALLLSRPGETALALWRPGGSGDLAEQLVEWWAVLADILTFYNERAMNEAFLGTATLDEAVKNLVRLLGYRPRPGIAAHGDVAALVSGKKPVTVRKGFQIQSKPGPGKQPQIFEVDADTVLTLPDALAVDPQPDDKLLRLDDGKSSLLLAGTVTSIKSGDRFLLRRRVWSGEAAERVLVTVHESKKEKTPRGVTNTRVVFTANIGHADARVADWMLLRATQSASLFATATQPIVTQSLVIDVFQGPALDRGRSALASSLILESAIAEPNVSFARSAGDFVIDDVINIFDPNIFNPRPAPQPPPPRPSFIVQWHDVHLDGVHASITAGDALLLERPDDDPLIARVVSHTRPVWYANASQANDPQTAPPKNDDEIAIPVVHSAIRIDPVLMTATEQSAWNDARGEVKVSFGWIEAGRLLGAPATTFHPATGAKLLAADANAASLTVPRDVQLEDANGAGTSGQVISANARQVGFQDLDATAAPLVAPLRLLANLVGVSRGKSVPSEILGSGDATVAGQSFTLKKAPLTYLASGDGYRSTLRIWVDDIEWQEASSFYAQTAEAKIFVTKEDAEQKTHVLFGDGINGARLPSGSNNIVAAYRYGSGAEVPETGSLNVILKPQPGVRGIRNPVPVFGGADPDAAAKVRTLAPRSVLTFGRAVSADDYEVIAAGAAGVQRARATWTFDATLQRAVVTVWVGDDAGAEKAARAALTGAEDPNRVFIVKLAQPVDCSVSLTLRIRADFAVDPVVAAVRAALTGEEHGLFGTKAVRIGQVIFNSEIDRACLSVPGTLAVHALQFRRGSAVESGARHDPFEGRFFRLLTLSINAEQV